MIFTRIIYSAILIGIVAGALLSVLQLVSLNPIIIAAEVYESGPENNPEHSSELDSELSHNNADGHHDDSHAADEFERSSYSFLANILVSTGFTAVLLALMVQFRIADGARISWAQGCLWGLAGFVAIFLAPALGLPPEIPGAEAAALPNRQLWWIFTVVSVAIGLCILAFALNKLKFTGLLFLAMPYLVGAPHNDGPAFTHADSEVVAALEKLHEQFIIASAGTSLVFWLLLGLACSYVFNRWFKSLSIDGNYVDA
ncbi:MAG: cobalt transporter subunit CbtA [Planctomycetota bacterium]|jgi:cobalt transporter subunit CbtA